MATILNPKDHDIGGIFVRRFLPHAEQRAIGPFVFLDQMGPGKFAAGEGIDVRPHPHIGLSTLTYLFEGSMLHRDSLGNHQEIRPGEVNWMTAGRGIVHSERESLEVRAGEHSIHGLQCWVALPEQWAEIEPSFTHVKSDRLPHLNRDGMMIRLIVGTAFGMRSPIKTYSNLFYVDVLAPRRQSVEVPEGSEAGIYMVYGQARVGRQLIEKDQFATLNPSDRVVEAEANSRFILLGGEPFGRPPHLFWNFVSFDRERIRQARNDWQEHRFPAIPGDDEERIPL
jgi:redox-sensitive bicupin YhaK (pirin superfamily)